MDMKCRKCREPWDWRGIRDDVLENQPLYKRMEAKGGYVKQSDVGEEAYEIGHFNTLKPGHKRTPSDKEKLADWHFGPGPTILQCPACIGQDIDLTEKQEFASQAEAALADILGNDVDGLMAEMEDLGFMFE